MLDLSCFLSLVCSHPVTISDIAALCFWQSLPFDRNAFSWGEILINLVHLEPNENKYSIGFCKPGFFIENWKRNLQIISEHMQNAQVAFSLESFLYFMLFLLLFLCGVVDAETHDWWFQEMSH